MPNTQTSFEEFLETGSMKALNRALVAIGIKLEDLQIKEDSKLMEAISTAEIESNRLFPH